MTQQGEVYGQDHQKKQPKKDIIAMLKNNPTRLRYLRDSLNYFTLIKQNIYLDRKRKIPKNDQMEPCYCKPKLDFNQEYTNVSFNCGQRCLNRMMSTQCDDQTCNCFEACNNRKFQKHQYACVYPKPQGGKGWGLCAGEKIARGDFIMQYIGQIFSTNSQIGKTRVKQYSTSACTYLMKTSKGQVIDPTFKGNLARFINHSCEPNCITQKWNVLGEICIGIFSLKDIYQDEQLSFDYQFDVYSTPLTKCLCGSSKCKGYLGLRPSYISAQQWNIRLEDMTCQLCDKNYYDDDVKLILCDQCNKGFHIFCLTPPLENIPEESFFCKECTDKKERNLLEKELIQREKNKKLTQTKMLILENQKYRKEEESQQEEILPVPKQYNRLFNFLKKQEERAFKQLQNVVCEDEKDEMIEQAVESPKKKHEVKKMPSASKKRDQFYQLTKKASDKLQSYLQSHQTIYQKITNFDIKKEKGAQDEKKTMQLNRIQMQVILKTNFILFQKIGAQIYYDINSRSNIDFFLKNTEVIVTGNQKQIQMFQEIVNISNSILNELQVQMGITQAYISIPAIFIKKLLGPGHIAISQIQRNHHVAVYYHKKYLNQECYPLQECCKLLLKGGRDNIIRAYEDIANKVESIEVERIYFNPYEIKTVVNNMPNLKRKHGMAQFRISRQSPFKQINHPFYFVQQKNKEIAIIGTRAEIEKTKKEIMYFFEEPNRKEEYNYNISLYLAQSTQKSILLGLKSQLEKEIPNIKMMIFDPTPPRKNMTLSFLGTRQNRLKAKQYLFSKLQQMNREGKFMGNLQNFQDQMNYQMTKYYFKYMQNTFLTKDTAFMKSWDILNYYYCGKDNNYMWKSVKKSLQHDYETLLYACFVLKEKILMKMKDNQQLKSGGLEDIYEIIRQNINRILTVYYVNNTSALKNYHSKIDPEEAKKCFKDVFTHVVFLKNSDKLEKHQKSQSNTFDLDKRELSFFEKKVFKKYPTLYKLLEEERQRSRDKEEQRKRDKWR